MLWLFTRFLKWNVKNLSRQQKIHLSGVGVVGYQYHSLISPPPLPVSKYLFRRSCSRLLLYPYSYMCLKSRAELQPHLAFMHIFRQKAGIKLFEIRYWKKKIFIWQLSRFFLLPLADFFHQLSRSQEKIGKHYSSRSSRPLKICGSLYWTQIRSVDLVWFGFIIGPCEQEHLKAQYVHCTHTWARPKK